MNKQINKIIDFNDRCRCCLERSDLKSLWEENYNNGEREIYGEKLSDCFSLNWQQPKETSHVEHICQVCVARLDDAVSFKKSILHAQEYFAAQIEQVSKKEVKEEVEDSETEIETDLFVLEYTDDDGDKKMQDPLPIQDDEKSFHEIKIEVEPLKVSDNEKLEMNKRRKYTEDDFKMCMEAVRNKSMSQVKASLAFKVPVRAIRKALFDLPKESQSGRRVYKPRPKAKKQQENIDCLLMNTNVTPIRGIVGRAYACYFCPKKYEQPNNLKEHTLSEHGGTKFEQLKVICDYNFKVDITKLTCTICNKNIDRLDDMWDHLSAVHQKTIHKDVKNQLVPFRLNNEDILKCVECFDEYKSFKLLNDHMNLKHYSNYECEKCGRGFISRKTLRTHIKRHDTGETFACQYCPKKFMTKVRRREHERWVHLCVDKRLKCGYCDEKFTDMVNKDKHQGEVHGVEIPVYKCQACYKSFRSQKNLRVHLKSYHLMLRPYKCTECELSFFQKTQLTHHMLKHTGIKDFKCNVCLKSYGRKNTLREHMRIHENDRRFACTHCTMAFIQKCRWRSHMRTVHGENI